MLDSVTDSSFDDFVHKHKEVVIDFWATWCHPCIEMEPRISEISASYAGRVAFAKMDIDKNPRISKRYKVNSIPAIFAFKEGKPVDKSIGAVSKRELVKFIDDAFD